MFTWFPKQGGLRRVHATKNDLVAHEAHERRHHDDHDHYDHRGHHIHHDHYRVLDHVTILCHDHVTSHHHMMSHTHVTLLLMNLVATDIALWDATILLMGRLFLLFPLIL